MKAVEFELEHETEQRRLAEQCLEDVRRECKKPLVVPALLKAFTDVAHLDDVGTLANSNAET